MLSFAHPFFRPAVADLSACISPAEKQMGKEDIGCYRCFKVLKQEYGGVRGNTRRCLIVILCEQKN